MKLNLGCGAQFVRGWVNVDYALGARLIKLPGFRAVNRKFDLFEVNWNEDVLLHDLTKRFPWSAGSASATYSSHTLEHMSREDGARFLAECHRVLRPGGVIRILVPDLRHLVRRYTNGDLRADYFVEALGMPYLKKGGPLKRALSPFVQFPHRCMYDADALMSILMKIGFRAEPRAPFDSGIEDISEIEIAARTQHAVIVEGAKI